MRLHRRGAILRCEPIRWIAGTNGADIILETRGLTKEFKASSRSRTCRCGSGAAPSTRSSPNARQDHLLQPADALPGADERPDLLQRQGDHRLPPRHHRAHGLVRSFQISAVFPHLTVLENVRIALQRKRGTSFDFWRSEQVLEQLNPRARELIEAVGLTEFTTPPQWSCPTAGSARSRSPPRSRSTPR